jgi:multidrug efflux pump subunit AcrA (membrane-fusion protein)
LKQPVAAANRSEEEGSVDAEPKVDLGSPTVWALAADGLVRPVAVKVGMSDGMVTEITGGNLEPGTVVVGNVVRESEPDFVSSFIMKIIPK